MKNKVNKSNNDKNMNELPFITISIITYNPLKEKLLKTVKSVLLQTGIKLQLVFSDDGSKENYFNQIEEYLKSENFTEYKFQANPVNQGTVINCLKAVELADGVYTKLLSPGDYLNGEYALKDWVEVMEAEQAQWSFCDAYYYCLDENKEIQLLSCNTNPNDIKPYVKKDNKMYRWNYLVLTDLCLGAATLYKTEVFLSYLKEISGKVVYAEDNILSLMMWDKCKVAYIPKHLLFYEYGTGISTVVNEKWKKRLENDYAATVELLLERMCVSNAEDWCIKKVILAKRTQNKWLRRIKKVLIPKVLWSCLKFKFRKKRKTPTVMIQEEELVHTN